MLFSSTSYGQRLLRCMLLPLHCGSIGAQAILMLRQTYMQCCIRCRNAAYNLDTGG